MSASNFQLITSSAPSRPRKAKTPIQMGIVPVIDKISERAERAQARMTAQRNSELKAMSAPRLVLQEEVLRSNVSPPPPLKMRHTSVPKRLSHEYSSPSHEVLSNRSHSIRPISPRTSPSPSRESLFRKSLSLQPISPRTIRSPSRVLSGGSARHPSSLTRRQKFDLDKSPSSFAFENEDLEDSQILREIEKERANYEIQKREEEMGKRFNKNDSDGEEEDSDDMSEDASDLPEYSDMDSDEEEGGKKGFNGKDARKNIRLFPTCRMVMMKTYRVMKKEAKKASMERIQDKNNILVPACRMMMMKTHRVMKKKEAKKASVERIQDTNNI